MGSAGLAVPSLPLVAALSWAPPAGAGPGRSLTLPAPSLPAESTAPTAITLPTGGALCTMIQGPGRACPAAPPPSGRQVAERSPESAAAPLHARMQAARRIVAAIIGQTMGARRGWPREPTPTSRP